MEHQKITNFLENASNQSSKFKTKNWVEIKEYTMLKFKLNLRIQC